MYLKLPRELENLTKSKLREIEKIPFQLTESLEKQLKFHCIYTVCFNVNDFYLVFVLVQTYSTTYLISTANID